MPADTNPIHLCRKPEQMSQAIGNIKKPTYKRNYNQAGSKDLN